MKYKNLSLADYDYGRSCWIKIIEIIILVLVILVPVVLCSRTLDIFLPAKELTFKLLVILGLMFWGLRIVSEEKLKIIRTPLDLPILSFMAISVLSLLWSNSPMVSLKELPLFLAGPFLFFIITNNIQDERQINYIIRALLIVGSLFGIYGILQYNGIDFSFWQRNIGRQKVFGLFGNVNFFAEYLILPLPIAVSLFFASRNKIKKILLSIGIMAMVGSLMVTFTRGSYLGFGAALIFMFLLYLISRGKKFIKENKKIFILILALIILSTFLFALPNPLNKPGTAISKIKSRISISQLTKDTSLKRRKAIWGFTSLMIKDHPILGSGLGTFKYNSLKYQAKFFEQGNNRSLYPYGFADKTHNEYLQMGVEIGLIGLGVFIWLMISYFNYGLKFLKRENDNYKQGVIIGLMGAVVAVLVDGIFGFPFHLPATVSSFWLIIGITMVARGSESEVQEINKLGRKNSDKRRKKRKNDIFKFKPLLYIGIILLSAFICITVVVRPFVAQTYWYYGYREIKKGNLDKAIQTYKEGLRWDPYLGALYYDIGNALREKGVYDLSQRYFEKAEKYADYPDLPLALAIVYIKNGLPEKAVVKLEQAISYQRDERAMAPLYSELGNSYFHLKEDKAAEVAFKSALKINPKYVNAHYGLAGAYLRQKKLGEAQEELQKVIELAPDSQEANYARNIVQQISQTKTKLKSQPVETNSP
jgi:O-antigen ligase/Tfp pilus assembly protein PilF